MLWAEFARMWCGQVKAHRTSNQNQKFIWQVTGAEEVRLPTADEEIDRTDCPHFNFDTDPFIWIKVPWNLVSDSSITVTCSRASDDTFPDGVATHQETLSIPVTASLSTSTKTIGYTTPTAPSQVGLNVNFWGASFMYFGESDNDQTGGPSRRYDSNNDFVINGSDALRGQYDVAKSIRYLPGNVSQLSYVSVLANDFIFVENPGSPRTKYTVDPSDYLHSNSPTQFDTWWDNPPVRVSIVNNLFQFLNRNVFDPETNKSLPVFMNLNGLGDCGGPDVIISKNANLLYETLAHEWGHNMNYAHVDTSSTQEEYVKNIMSYSNGSTFREWVTGQALTVDATTSCGKTAPDVQLQTPANPL